MTATAASSGFEDVIAVRFKLPAGGLAHAVPYTGGTAKTVPVRVRDYAASQTARLALGIKCRLLCCCCAGVVAIASASLTEAWKDNVVFDYGGIAAMELTNARRAQLFELIGFYIHHMDDGHARVKMDEVLAHIDQTYFAWIG
jgi:Protein of unknown function (DUF3500)